MIGVTDNGEIAGSLRHTCSMLNAFLTSFSFDATTDCFY